MVAMLRSWADAPARSASATSGRRPMSTSRVGRSTSSRIRSTWVVPPARKAPPGSPATAAIASSASPARRYSKGRTVVPSCDLADGGDDVGVRAAAAQVAAHELPDLRVRSRPALGQQTEPGHDLTRRAVAALESVVADEGLLQRVQPPVPCQPFDRHDLAALGGDGQREARQDTPAVQQDRAGAARPLVAALLRAAEAEAVPQRVQQADPGVHPQGMVHPVDPQRQRGPVLRQPLRDSRFPRRHAASSIAVTAGRPPYPRWARDRGSEARPVACGPTRTCRRCERRENGQTRTGRRPAWLQRAATPAGASTWPSPALSCSRPAIAGMVVLSGSPAWPRNGRPNAASTERSSE